MLIIVLLPGMDGTGGLFEPFISAMGKEFGICVVSYPTSGALGYAELEAHARASLPGNERFVILGESFSGPIAISIAASQPKGLVGLVLCSTFARNPRPLFGPLRLVANALPVKLAPLAILSALLMGRFATPELRAALEAVMSQVSAEALRARLRAVLSVEVSAKLQDVDVPVLYLLATQDQVVPSSASKHIRHVLPATEVVPIKAPHFLLQAAPAEAAHVVSSFMRSLHNAP